jgi:hypothetical protein
MKVSTGIVMGIMLLFVLLAFAADIISFENVVVAFLFVITLSVIDIAIYTQMNRKSS